MLPPSRSGCKGLGRSTGQRHAKSSPASSLDIATFQPLKTRAAPRLYPIPLAHGAHIIRTRPKKKEFRTMALSATLSFLIRQFDERVADKATRDKFYDDVMEFSYRQPFIAVCFPPACPILRQLY